MAIIDNTLAAQVPTYDAAAPLVQAAKLQAADQEMQQAKFKQNQVEMGSEMRGLQPFVNSPEFPAKWAEAANKLRDRGVIDDQMHQQWVNSPSPLLMKSIIAKTEDPALSFQKEEAQRQQKNQDRSYGLLANADKRAARAADRADQTPLEAMQERSAAAEAAGLEPGTPAYTAFGLTGTLPASVTNGGKPEVGLNPAYGTTSDGKVGAIQFSKTGEAVQTKLPEGFSLSKEPIKVDLGTHIQLYDPITRQPIGTPIAKNIAGAEAAKEEGSAQGLAKVALPQMLATSEQILKTIDDIEKHPGKEYSLGLYSKLPTIPGSSQADFRAAASQLKGQTFLQAYNTLKGGGAITDIEGAKAENALARLDQAQSTEAYDEALKDFKKVIKGGMERAKAKAGVSETKKAKDPVTVGGYTIREN